MHEDTLRAEQIPRQQKGEVRTWQDTLYVPHSIAKRELIHILQIPLFELPRTLLRLLTLFLVLFTLCLRVVLGSSNLLKAGEERGH